MLANDDVIKLTIFASCMSMFFAENIVEEILIILVFLLMTDCTVFNTAINVISVIPWQPVYFLAFLEFLLPVLGTIFFRSRWQTTF